MVEEKLTQDENEVQESYIEENREILLGICFGIGIGVFAGAFINNVMLGISGGGVVGVVLGVAAYYYRKLKAKKMFRKI